MTISRTWWQQFCEYHASEDQWDQASLPVQLAGLGVNQTKVTAASAYVGSCTLTKNLVAAMLGVDAEKFDVLEMVIKLHEGVLQQIRWASAQQMVELIVRQTAPEKSKLDLCVVYFLQRTTNSFKRVKFLLHEAHGEGLRTNRSAK